MNLWLSIKRWLPVFSSNSINLNECQQRNSCMLTFFKFSNLLLCILILLVSWRRRKHKRRSFKLDIVAHFQFLDCYVTIRLDSSLFLKSKYKEDVIEMSYTVPDVKKIIHLCSNVKHLAIMVKMLKLKHVSLLKNSKNKINCLLFI